MHVGGNMKLMKFTRNSKEATIAEILHESSMRCRTFEAPTICPMRGQPLEKIRMRITDASYEP